MGPQHQLARALPVDQRIAYQAVSYPQFETNVAMTKAARAWLYTILRNEHARLYERQRPEARDPFELPDLPVQGYDTSAEAFVRKSAAMRLMEAKRVAGEEAMAEAGRCLDCGKCTSACPVARYNHALSPRRLMRRLAEGRPVLISEFE